MSLRRRAMMAALGAGAETTVQHIRLIPDHNATQSNPVTVTFDFKPKNYVLVLAMAEQQQTPIKSFQIMLSLTAHLANGKFAVNNNSGWWSNSAGTYGVISGGTPLTYDAETGVATIPASAYAKLFEGVPYDLYLIDLGDYEVTTA